MEGVKFAVGEPAAVIGKSLVVSDLHVGVELELQAKGVEVSNYALEAKRLNALLKKMKCDSLIVLGDFKHDYYGFKNKEFWILKKFLSLLNCDSVTVIKGNHDSQLEDFDKVRVIDAKGLLVKEGKITYGLFHGHAIPSKEVLEKSDVFLLGNAHPLLQITEGERLSYTTPVWLMGKTRKNAKMGLASGKKWVLFPAFGSLAGGIAVNKRHDLGPFLKKENVDLRKAQVFLVSGQTLGLLESLE